MAKGKLVKPMKFIGQNIKIARHWMDSVRTFKPERLPKIKQKKSKPGQLSLFEQEAIEHLKPKKKK